MIVTWAVEAERDLVRSATALLWTIRGGLWRLAMRSLQPWSGSRICHAAAGPGGSPTQGELVLAPLPWIAIYRVDSAAVTILRILHGIQDWPVSEVP